MKPTKKQLDRFWSYVDRKTNDDCWSQKQEST